ncbi:MAG: glutamate 5-kinase [Bacillota bacterium]
MGGQARLVVKVGSSTLTHSTGKLNLGRMEALARELSDLANAGHRPILVTSGAVAAGMGRLGRSGRPRSLAERQAMAAVGQGLLMQIYEKFFGEYNQIVAQVLLTRDDTRERRRYLNARRTLFTLLELGVIPIINENDTVATEELQCQFGENDTLAAMVAGLVGADLLVLISDVDGLYTADPRRDPGAIRIPEVEEITPELLAAAGGAGTNLGSGGMASKLEAARIATSSGCPMALIAGEPPGMLGRLLRGEDVGTVFLPRARTLPAREQWIAFGQVPHGELVVDAGAARALREGGKSLLPSGIVAVRGEFVEGDLVKVLDQEGKEIARGLVNYNHEDVAKLMGHRTSEIERLLGRKGYDEIIHRDNMVCL